MTDKQASGIRVLRDLGALLVCALVLAWGGPAEARRVALVIGNSTYANVSALANPQNDAAALAATLRSIGFDEVRELVDLDQTAFRRALREFTSLSAGAETAVIYYAGHGVEVDGRNYLVPVDATLSEATDAEFEAIPLDNARTAVSGASQLRLVILDACRNNPFKLQSANGTRSVGRGLARVEPGANEIVAYAAREGTVAADGEGANSPYASALVKHLKQPGLDVRLLFGEVRDEVMRLTGKKQEPFIYGTLGGQPIFLVPPATSEPPPDLQPAAGDDRSRQAAEAWIAVKDTTSLALLKTYISRFEGTIFADLAAARLAELEASISAPAPEPEPTAAQPEPPAPSETEVAVGPIDNDTDNIDLAEPPHVTLQPRVYPVGKWAEGLAFDGERLWVAESGQRTVGAYDLDGNLLNRVKVGRLPVGVESTADGTVYSLQHTDSTIWLHPPGKGKSRRVAAVDKCPWDLAVTAKAQWVLTWPDCSSGDSLVMRIDAKSGKTVRTPWLGSWGEKLAFGHDAAWVAHAQGDVISRIDAASLTVERVPVAGISFWSINAEGPMVIAGGRLGDDNARGVIVGIDPSSRNEVTRQTVDDMVLRLAIDDRNVVALGLNGSIWVLSRDSLAIERKISLGIGAYRPSDALIIGESLYVVAQQLGGENGAVLVVDGWRSGPAGAAAD